MYRESYSKQHIHVKQNILICQNEIVYILTNQ